MDPKLPEPLSELLEYVEGIGYSDLYLSAPLRDASASRPLRDASASRPLRDASASRPQRDGAARPDLGPSAQRPEPSSRQVSPAERDADHPKAPPHPQTSDRSATERPAPVRPAPAQPMPSAGSVAPLLADGVPEDVAGRLQALAGIAGRAASCQACGLCRGRRTVVFGQGHPDADLMFIGEGPGAQEDRQGLPFVGPAGELLNKIIAAIDETRDGVYIANVVKCRPPNNRDPLPDEVEACRAYLEAQIDLIRPKVLVALGRVAAQALLGSRDSLGRLRGRWHEVRGVPTRATYHPAALLRNASWKRPTWEDMQLVRDRLRELRRQ